MKTLIVILFFLLTGCFESDSDMPPTGWAHHPNIDLAVPTLNPAPGYFADCSELSAWLLTKQQQFDYYTSWIGGDAMPGYGPVAYPVPSPAALNRPVRANMQSAGVAQPDLAAVDNSRVFFARSQSVEILAQGSLQLLQTLTFTDLAFPLIYAQNNQLIVMGGAPDASQAFTLKVYEPGSGGEYVLQSEESFNGQFLGARLVGGVLTLILENVSAWDTPDYVQNNTFFGVSCAQIQKPFLDDFNQALTTIVRLPLNGSGAPTTMAVWGGAEAFYQTASGNLYLGFAGLVWFPWDARQDFSASSNLTLSRYTVGAQISLTAVGQLGGLPVDTHSFLETADPNTVIVATNTGFTTLTATAGAFNTVSSIPLTTDAVGNYSLLWLGNEAVVAGTGLNVFSFAQMAQPAQLNGLPSAVSAGALASAANSLVFAASKDPFSGSGQLAFVDVSTPAAPLIVDSQTFAGGLIPWTLDDRAIDIESTYIALPMLQPSFAGLEIYAPAAPLTQLATVSHADWLPANCSSLLWQPNLNIQRALTVNGALISLSAFGAKSSDPLNAFAVTASTPFANEDSECTMQLSPPVTYGPIANSYPFFY